MSRIAAKCFLQIRFRLNRRMAVLHQMHPMQIQLLHCLEGIGMRHKLHRRGNVGLVQYLLCIVQQGAALCIQHIHRVQPICGREGQRLRHTGLRLYLTIQQAALPAAQRYAQVMLDGGGLYAERTARQIHIHSRFQRGKTGLAQRAYGIPELGKALGLIGVQPGEVRLIVGIGACHQLTVGAVRVSQRLLPAFCQLAKAPGEHLFTRRHMVVGDVNHARLFPVVVAAKEVVLGGRSKMRCGVGVVFVP